MLFFGLMSLSSIYPDAKSFKHINPPAATITLSKYAFPTTHSRINMRKYWQPIVVIWPIEDISEE